ncbi:MAG TPA: glycosyltransferase family 2 protein [Chthoniobacterales bacterium]|nr:glycosyltransferase family 2 protein [Chthoniobacterales bacterium]
MAALRVPEAAELAVVMPVFNEAVNLRPVVCEWFGCLRALGADFVFIAVNDGSTDKTAEELARLAHDLGPKFQIVNKPNSGHGRSCREGYEHALAEGADWILQIDSDGQCDPAFFPELYAARTAHDCVFAYRQTRGDGWGRTAVSFCCRLLLFSFAGSYLRDPNVPYRMIRAGALRAALHRIPADFDLQNIALTFALSREPDLRWKYFPIHFRARRGGKNSINYRKIVKMGLNLIRDLGRIRDEDSPRWQRPAWARRGAVS